MHFRGKCNNGGKWVKCGKVLDSERNREKEKNKNWYKSVCIGKSPYPPSWEAIPGSVLSF
jgi:hypothetical protein